MDPVIVRKQAGRLTSSPSLSASETSCRLLTYLVDQALSNPGQHLKEHQIAMEVFGRPSDFDPRLDAIVRVQLGRLRTRIAEYYAGPGREDSIVLEIPKGTHTIALRDREPDLTVPAIAAIAADGGATAVVAPAMNAVFPNISPRHITIAVFAVVCAGLFLAGWILGKASEAQVTARAAKALAEPEPVLIEFWGPFAQSASTPLLVYSNAEFVGRPQTGMRYFDADKDSPALIKDSYTGIGEVMAAVELTRTLGRLGRDIHAKRGRLLTLDDVKTHNVVFVGSPAENLVLRDLPITRDFVFERSSLESAPVVIVNKRPQPNESARYSPTPTVPVVEDYAVVSSVHGLSRNHRILVLAGTTTLGTQAAVEFVCRASDLENLLARLPKRTLSNFEAVIKVRIAKGVPVSSEVVALHNLADPPLQVKAK